MGADSTRAPDGATALTNTAADAAILAAWGRRSVAYADFNSWPLEGATGHDPKADAAQIKIVDAAEEEIRGAVATTPLGVEIQLWTSFAHGNATRYTGEDQAANVMDLDFFMAKEGDLDWNERLILAALRSLRAMRGAA